MTDVADVVAAIEQLRVQAGRVVVGVSGFAGAGKSVLVRHLVDAVPDAARLRGDDFLDPPRVHRRSPDWDGVERLRMRTEVLDPFRAGSLVMIRPLDWSTGRLGEPTPLPRASVLVVDSIGIFHPELLPCFDLTVWVDVDLTTAQSRGMGRDRAAGHDHDLLWADVWTPNDQEFEQTFLSSTSADMRCEPPPPGARISP